MKSKLIVAVSLAALAFPVHAGISYLGSGAIPGNATDNSGLTETVTWSAGSMPHNQVGGFGSAIAYTGTGNRYVATPDRGPGDGLVNNYFDRMYEININVTCPSNACAVGGWTVSPTLVDTKLLTNQAGAHFNGNSSNIANGLRFDPEGIRVSGNGASVFVSDEYGPYVYRFDRATGQLQSMLNVPSKFAIANPNSDSNTELTTNTSGRAANRGMEGLAISPDNTKLYGIMQSPLLQDGLFATNSINRRGVNDRIVAFDLMTGLTQEYLYQLGSNRADGVTSTLGVSEMLAVNEHQFLVLERDGDAGNAAAFKNIFLIDIAGATDISSVASLPQKLSDPLPLVNGLPLRSASKTPFLNLLDSAFGLAGANFPEKIEGLAFGPDFNNGDHLLLVTVDNDFFTDRANLIYAFRITPDALPGFVAQQIPEPSALLLMALGLLVLTRARVVDRPRRR